MKYYKLANLHYHAGALKKSGSTEKEGNTLKWWENEDNKHKTEKKEVWTGYKKKLSPMKTVKLWRWFFSWVVQTESGHSQVVTGKLVWPGGWPCFEQWPSKAAPAWTIPHSCDCPLCLQPSDVIWSLILVPYQKPPSSWVPRISGSCAYVCTQKHTHPTHSLL